jgi:hypothetical protein
MPSCFHTCAARTSSGVRRSGLACGCWRCIGVAKPSQKLQAVPALTPDALAAEVMKARGRSKPLSVADVKRLTDEYARSVAPLHALTAEASHQERRVAELVNAAYGLTAAEVALLWETAPPRMPAGPPPTASASARP